MSTEIEAKFLKINPGDMAARLGRTGYTCIIPRRMMTRVTMHKPAEHRNPNEWWRVRNEGTGVITMTWKRTDQNTIDGTREFETTVGDFDMAVNILKTAGLEVSSYQETCRATWNKGDVEVVIDEWPGLNPFIEIEGPNVDVVTHAAQELGFDMASAVFGGVGVIYHIELGYDPTIVNNWPEILFQNPPKKAA